MAPTDGSKAGMLLWARKSIKDHGDCAARHQAVVEAVR
jgi:hypothetical protein